MTNKEITKVIFNNSEISALYYGDVLVWEKENGNTYEEGLFAGKLIDEITADKASITVQNEEYSYKEIALPYNKETKEFSWKSESELKIFELVDRDIYKEIYNYPNYTSMNSCMDEFSGCTNLTSISLFNFDTTNSKAMDSMFYNCRSLTSLDLSSFNTANCKSMFAMFGYCSALTTLNFGNFNTSNVIAKSTDPMTGMYWIFYNCKALANVTGVFEGTKDNLDLQYSPLTNSSAMVFINGLSNVTETKTLSFKSSTYNTLTPEQIATATSKGWTVISI